jgi:hypothetical protein
MRESRKKPDDSNISAAFYDDIKNIIVDARGNAVNIA